MTRDLVLVCRHEPNLLTTVDTAKYPVLAGRGANHTIDGEEEEGWFTHDFTWEARAEQTRSGPASLEQGGTARPPWLWRAVPPRRSSARFGFASALPSAPRASTTSTRSSRSRAFSTLPWEQTGERRQREPGTVGLFLDSRGGSGGRGWLDPGTSQAGSGIYRALGPCVCVCAPQRLLSRRRTAFFGLWPPPAPDPNTQTWSFFGLATLKRELSGAGQATLCARDEMLWRPDYPRPKHDCTHADRVLA